MIYGLILRATIIHRIFIAYVDKLSLRETSDYIKGRVHVFFIRELDVPPLGKSSLKGPKKSVFIA